MHQSEILARGAINSSWHRWILSQKIFSVSSLLELKVNSAQITDTHISSSKNFHRNSNYCLTSFDSNHLDFSLKNLQWIGLPWMIISFWVNFGWLIGPTRFWMNDRHNVIPIEHCTPSSALRNLLYSAWDPASRPPFLEGFGATPTPCEFRDQLERCKKSTIIYFFLILCF